MRPAGREPMPLKDDTGMVVAHIGRKLRVGLFQDKLDRYPIQIPWGFKEIRKPIDRNPRLIV